MAFPEHTVPATKVSTAMVKNPEVTNKFLASELFLEKCNLVQWNHLPEQKFLTPDSVVKDELPRAHEGPRHWTEKAISAQLTGSDSFATTLLTSLFTGVTCTPKQICFLLNLAPYHGNVETQSIELMLTRSWSGPRMCTFSASFDAPQVGLAKKNVKDYLFKTWKSRTADELLSVDPNTEVYKSDPPVFLGNARKPMLNILQVDDETKAVRVPQDLVQLYGKDPLKKDEWLKMVKDVEQLFPGGDAMVRTDSPKASETSTRTSILPFPDDPLREKANVQQSNIYCQFPGKDTTYSWLIIKDGDNFRGYIVNEKDAPCTADGLALAYGRGQWHKSKTGEDSVAGLSAPGCRDVLCKYESLTSEKVVVEGVKGDGPVQDWVSAIMAIIKTTGPSTESHLADISISCHKVLNTATNEEVKLSAALVDPSTHKLEQKEVIIFKPDTMSTTKVTDLRHTNCAGLTSRDVLSDSPGLELVWRVKYFENCHEMAPRKPLWYFKGPINLDKKGEMRRVF